MGEIMGHAFVLIGATGDLAKRKLLPALYHIHKKNKSRFPIICVGRRNISTKEYLRKFGIRADKSFLKRISYVPAKFTKEGFLRLKGHIEKKDKSNNLIFYLALPPSAFTPAVRAIKVSGMLKGKGWKRCVFEKPFGYDLRSARKLNVEISKVFREEQVYRIDHYLGKELVQNVLVMRFSNAAFEQIWNRDFVDHVQITIFETIGVEGRGGYYDKAGAVRDMIQNHMLQVLALTAMESPKSLDADDIRDAKVRVFSALRKVRPEDIVTGQYAGYTKEEGVKRGSKTETFAALELRIDNDRWKDVPFFVRTGKKMEKHYAEVNLVLKDVSCKLFSVKKVCVPMSNVITIRIQPDEGVVLNFNAKTPGSGLNLHPAKMEFC
ncbi:MAG: glucose-6-phosphate dehydrogenase, partial [Candidatus Nanoarchaeia archaeon]